MNDAATLDAEWKFDHADLEPAIEQGRETIQSAAQGGLGRLSWPLVKNRLADAIGDQLDRNGIAWFAGAWSFVRTLRSYKDKEKYPPRKRVFVKLGEHELTGVLEPQFSIECAGLDLATIAFQVEVIAAFNAVTLSIRNGHITGFGGGDCAISVQLKCGGKEIGDRLKLKEFELPGDYKFEAPGIAIP